MVGGEKKIGAAEGRSGREEVEASSKARHVPDHLLLCKDITLFNSIVPPSPKRLPIQLRRTPPAIFQRSESRRKDCATSASKETCDPVNQWWPWRLDAEIIVVGFGYKICRLDLPDHTGVWYSDRISGMFKNYILS